MTLELKLAAAAAAALALAGAAAGSAAAQSLNTNSAEFNGGWGRFPGQENQPIDVSTRDEFGNRVIVDGIIQDGSDNTTFTQQDNTGAGSVYSGAGGRGGSRWSSATAIGNNLQVITQGSYNTVIVNSTQINNGNVTASNGDSLNGELDLDD
jgi:holdfast attachment protein HfaA